MQMLRMLPVDTGDRLLWGYRGVNREISSNTKGVVRVVADESAAGLPP
ncbi:hypothetical protein ACIKP9_08160 [Methylobacillus methanolivorans]|uniref:Uncharacterized protein n=1 Tax=Methylobacillus methanolivorans TaxID=1848927 RepID=A0ABW8GLE2_9PROT